MHIASAHSSTAQLTAHCTPSCTVYVQDIAHTTYLITPSPSTKGPGQARSSQSLPSCWPWEVHTSYQPLTARSPFVLGFYPTSRIKSSIFGAQLLVPHYFLLSPTPPSLRLSLCLLLLQPPAPVLPSTTHLPPSRLAHNTANTPPPLPRSSPHCSDVLLRQLYRPVGHHGRRHHIREWRGIFKRWRQCCR